MTRTCTSWWRTNKIYRADHDKQSAGAYRGRCGRNRPLSYSEIKALATGNPLIIEKCNLDMEVGKLNMLKASYLSQKYALEELVLRKYPAKITRLTERIVGYEQDVQLAAAHPKPKEGFAGITILDQTYAGKEAAGKAILDVCSKMTGDHAAFLGQYRGFSITPSPMTAPATNTA